MTIVFFFFGSKTLFFFLSKDGGVNEYINRGNRRKHFPKGVSE